jgi:hypothetical protein
VYYELSFAQEALGDLDRAYASVQKVKELDARFPGVSQRLSDLEAGGTTSPKLGEPGEGFESFDDLFDDDDDDDEGGDVAMVEAVPAETFESLEEIAEDANANPEPEITPSEPEPEPEPEPDPNGQSARKTGRKRISFV